MSSDRLKSRTPRNALILSFALAALPALGAEVDRIASFSAGDPPPCGDSGPDIAAQPGGSFLLIWQRTGCPDYSTLKARAQRFDAAGRPLAPAVALWSGLAPQVAPLPDGGFVATSWFELGPFPSAIGLHRLDAFGRPIGEPIAVTIDPNFEPNVDSRLAVAPHGEVVVVWRETPINFEGPLSVFGRFYDAALEPATEAVPLSNDSTNAFQHSPDIAFRSDATALAVWTAFGAGDARIFGRMFDASGHPLTDVFPISQTEQGRFSTGPRVVAGTDGGWWVGWYRHSIETPPAAGAEGRVVRLGVGGERLGAEQILGASLNPDVPLSLGADPAGSLLVLAVATDDSISGRRFGRDGAPASNLFELSGSSPQSFRGSTLGDRSSGGFLAAWSAADVTGAILTPGCLDGKSAACLGPDGRYGVEVAWQNGASHGTAKPLPLAGNVATFGLRNAADHDVTVLLSGSGSRDLTFAATTGASLEIRVTDKTTGTVSTFFKPAGRFASRRFQDALPSLAGDIEVSAATPSLDDADLVTLPAIGETCVPTSRALCLLGGRFRAELFGGQSTRPALAILRTDKSGTFAFPSAPDTPLVTLTMIDGRASNGKFWVYLGGLSRAGYKVKITDLSTGVAKNYSNPAGKLESRADRTAF